MNQAPHIILAGIRYNLCGMPITDNTVQNGHWTPGAGGKNYVCTLLSAPETPLGVRRVYWGDGTALGGRGPYVPLQPALQAGDFVELASTRDGKKYRTYVRVLEITATDLVCRECEPPPLCFNRAQALPLEAALTRKAMELMTTPPDEHFATIPPPEMIEVVAKRNLARTLSTIPSDVLKAELARRAAT